jgi:hypothetical protein
MTENIAENPGLLPYGSNVSAPAIKIEDISSWKTRGVQKVNNQLKTKFFELRDEYEKLIEELRWNDLVYKSQFSFEPVIGQIYHLYANKNEKLFLSLIGPKEWNQKHLGTFKLNSEQKWVKLNE